MTQGAGRVGVPVVAFGGRRSAELDAAFLTVGAQSAGAIEDAQVVARQGLAARWELHRRLIVLAGGLGNTAVHERRALDAIEDELAVRPEEGHANAVFGEPVRRAQRCVLETVLGKAVVKPAQRRRQHRFRAVRRDAPRRQIDTDHLFVANARQAKLVREIGGSGQCSPVLADRLQPTHRSRKEPLRGHQHDGDAEVHARHPRGDEAHVVIER